MRTREAALAALFAVGVAAYPWMNTPRRRLVLFDKVPPMNRPAMYQFEGGNAQYRWNNNSLPVNRLIEAKWFIYFNSRDQSSDTAPLLNAVMDAVDVALQPRGMDLAAGGRCSLGGTCDWCRIDGEVVMDPGDIDTDGVIIVPIKITLP